RRRDADPGRNDDHAAPGEELEMHAVALAGRAAAEGPDGTSRLHGLCPRGRPVGGADADRRRNHARRRRGDHRRTAFGSPARTPSTAAADPLTIAAAVASRASPGESGEITTPCQKAPREPRLSVAARPPRRTGSANGAVLPTGIPGGGASRWSCHVRLCPRVRRTQPGPAFASLSDAAVGDARFAQTPSGPNLATGSPTRPRTTR